MGVSQNMPSKTPGEVALTNTAVTWWMGKTAIKFQYLA